MCGFIGIVGVPSAAKEIYDGLVAIQHRGQDAAGIITYDGRFHVKKGEGLVRDIFSAANFERLKGNLAVGHVRDLLRPFLPARRRVQDNQTQLAFDFGNHIQLSQ